MGKTKRSSFEFVVIAAVVVLTLVMAVSLYAARAKVVKGDLLLNELGMLRSSLMTYKLVNHKSAQDLKQLSTEYYEVGGEKKTYIDSLPVNKAGVVVDPFGNPYKYDPANGWVSSTTQGFERW